MTDKTAQRPGEPVSVETLGRLMTPGARIAGLDLGTKTIGVAISDPGFAFAHPRPVIRRIKFTKDAEALLALLAKEGCGGIVIGLPLNMDGSEGPRVQATRAFQRNLSQLTSLPMAYWDERLSTVAAERGLLEQDMSRAKRAERIDSAAAAYILQGALDRLYSAGIAGAEG